MWGCSFCRKRKIRCEPDPKDPTRRCKHCQSVSNFSCDFDFNDDDKESDGDLHKTAPGDDASAITRDDLTHEPTDGAESSELSELETEPELPAAEIAAGFDADLDADSEAESERLYDTPKVSSAPSRSTRPRI